MADETDVQRFDGDFTEDDWREAFELSSPNRYTLSRDRSEVTLVGVIEWGKLKACIQYLLGYSLNAAGGVGGYGIIQRRTPAFHPYFPWLYCVKISDIRPMGLGASGGEAVQGDWSDTFKYGEYSKVMVTACYESLPYEVLEDSSPEVNRATTGKGEWNRYTILEPQPYTEMLTLDNGQMLYDAPDVPAVDGKPLVQPVVFQRMKKCKYLFHWKEVPWDYICNSYGVPAKLQAVQKCVNKSEFLGFAAGTLLCEDVQIEKKVMPVATDLLNTQLFYADVTFTFIQFDPPTNPDYPSITARGWNLAPHTSGYWYPCKSPTGSRKLFDEYHFQDCFDAVNAPVTT